MRRFGTLLVWLGLAAALCGDAVTTSGQGGPRGYAFVNANVITMRDDAILARHTVLVLGDTIAAVGPQDAVEVPPGVEVIDAAGGYVLPGLADMHIHLHDERELLSYMRYGVTTALQMSTDSRTPANIRDLRRRLARGEMLGPTLYSTGPMFAEGRFSQQGRREVTPEDVPALLEAHRAEGYEFIKVHNMVPPDVYRALVAADVLPVVGHLPVMMTPQDALRSGQRMVAHAELFYYKYFFDNGCLATTPFWECAAQIEPDFDRIAAIVRVVDSVGVVVTANLSYTAADLYLTRNADSVLADPEHAFLVSRVAAGWQRDLPADRSFAAERRRDVETRYPFVQQLVKAFADAHVPLLAGTDTPLPGLYPGKSIHLELAELVRAGLSPFAALEAATVTPGRFIRDHVPGAEPFGMIRPGYRADLLLVRDNPLAWIGNLAEVSATMVRGAYWSTAALDSLRGR